MAKPKKAPRLSIVIAVLDSHEVVRRQCEYWKTLSAIKDVEIILVDDGSLPPLKATVSPYMKDLDIRVIKIRESRPWNQPCARNVGAFAAKSRTLLMTDIDHILTNAAIKAAKEFEGDKLSFVRRWGVLIEEGILETKTAILNNYGRKKGTKQPGPHLNTFAIRKYLFHVLGGYKESFCGKYGGDDTDFARRYSFLVKAKEAKRSVLGPKLFVFPDPRRDVKNLFHSLRKKKRS